MRFIPILLLFLFHSLLFAETSFDAFKKKDFLNTEKLLLQEMAEKGESALLLYNLGVTSEKRGNQGYAAYYYIQSLQYAPEFKEARQNLDIITKNSGIKIPATLLNHSSAFFVTVLFFAGTLYLFTIMLIFFMWNPSWKIKIALIPAFMILIFASALFVYRYRDMNAVSYAVAVVDTEQKSGPDTSMSSLGKIKKGEVLIVLDVSGNWAKTESFQDHSEGWIDLNAVKNIRKRVD